VKIEAGTKIDRYQIISQIGKGGMGEVYLAHDPRLGRKVALKLLPAQYLEDAERLRRFEQEAQVVSALNHPNIVNIFDIGEAGGRPFIVTEYIEGTTLRQAIAASRLKIRQILNITTQVVSALAAAHAAGIIHRDLKPENIMIRPDGYVKMLDFGLAKLTEKSIIGDPPSRSTAEILSPDAVDIDTAAVPLFETSEDALATDHAGTANETIPGVVMGTAQYMSPEQARGFRVDARTDIFSLGIVLYEMLANRLPFRGGTPRQILDAILHSEPPPPSQFNPEIREVLDWIVSKALIKDRDERYQTAREMLNDVRRLYQRIDIESERDKVRPDSDSLQLAQAPPDSHSNGKSTLAYPLNNATTNEIKSSFSFSLWKSDKNTLTTNRPFLLTLIFLSAVSLIFLTYLVYRVPKQSKYPFQSFNVSPFTSTGKAFRAAISPDGNYIVYVQNEAGRQGLFVRQVTLSNNVPIVPMAEVTYRGLTFSHDGTYIFYVLQQANDPIQSLYQVPVLGGNVKKILTNIDSPVAISRDNRHLAFIRRNRGLNEDALIVADRKGENESQIATRRGNDFFGTSGLDFSPDGKMLACPAGTNTGGRQMYIALIDAADGKESRIGTRKWATVGRLSWLPKGNGLLMSAIESGSNQGQIWEIDYPSGEYHRVTSDLSDYRDLNLTSDTRAAVTIRSESLVNIYLIPVSEASQAIKVTDGIGQYYGVGGVTWQSNDRIAFVSRASGSQDLWLMDRSGQNQRQLTTAETRADRYPAVSPDGKHIVFVSTRTGNSNLYRFDVETGEQAQLTHGMGEEFPAITPDGKWVIYTTTSSIKFTLWKVSIDGGNPIQLTEQLSQWPTVSPDGKWIACWYRSNAQSRWQIGILPISGGTPTNILDVPSSADPAIPIKWMPDGHGICFLSNKDGAWNLMNKPLDNSDPKPLTNFSTDQIFWFDWSPDGKWIACSRGKTASDVVLITETTGMP
jgi:serine/threonine protein kinase